MTTTVPFLGQFPDEIALFVIRNLPGHHLVQLKEVDRRAHDLVIALFKGVGYWRSLGFEEGREPTQAQVHRAFSLIKQTGPWPTILEMPKLTSPMSWMIIKQLNLVLLDSLSNPLAVATRAASLGDADLCLKVLTSATFSGKQFSLCMDEAIKGGHLHVVKMLLNLGTPISPNSFFESIRQGQIAIAERLATQKPHLLCQITELQWAAFRGRTDEFHALVSTPDALEGFNGLPPPLHVAAYSGQVSAITTLYHLRNEIIHKTGEFGETALHAAAMNGHTEVIRVLVALGCSVNARDQYGQPALHFAAWQGHVEAVRVLAELKCCINLTDLKGQTALHKAAWYGQRDVITTLTALESSLHTCDDKGRTALHYAARHGHTDAVKQLVALGCSVHATNGKGQSALHYAARYGLMDIINALVSLGCPVGAVDKKGKTALHLAAMSGHTDAVKRLAALGCAIDAKDLYEQTALHYAARHGLMETIILLMSLKCPLGATDKTGRTALDYAATGGFVHAALFLEGLEQNQSILNREFPLESKSSNRLK